MNYQISEERRKYHDIIPSFIKRIKREGIVYDIGKSHLHEYRSTFAGFHYLSVDRDPNKAPDILLDVEKYRHGLPGLQPADALMCNGVIEQCDDPIEIIKACNDLLVAGGVALFGMVLLGYPPHENDRFRFTKNGAMSALVRYGFQVDDVTVIERSNIPSYIYAICTKTREV